MTYTIEQFTENLENLPKVELEEMLSALKSHMEERERYKFKAKKGDVYYCVQFCFNTFRYNVIPVVDTKHSTDAKLFESGNYHLDKSEAEAEADFLNFCATK